MTGIGREFLVFVIAVTVGVNIRLAYQCLICLRGLVHHSICMIGIEDLFFWIVSAIYIFVQIYQTSNGSIRWYFILGVVFGGGLTHFFIRKIQNLHKKIYTKDA